MKREADSLKTTPEILIDELELELAIARGKVYSCPFCALRVIADDATRTTHHEVPICRGWRELVESSGAVLVSK